MPQTGQTCQTSGIYRGDCGHRPERSIPKGHTFPPCSDCKRAINWTLERAVEEAEEGKEITHTRAKELVLSRSHGINWGNSPVDNPPRVAHNTSMGTELTTRQVADYHGISVAAVRRLVQRGKLTPTRREGLLSYWFRAADVRQLEPPKRGRPPGSKDGRKRARRMAVST